MSVYDSEGEPVPTPTPDDTMEPTPVPITGPTPAPMMGPTPAPMIVEIDGYLGCYADSEADRIMVLEASQNDMTTAVRSG